MNVQTFLFFIVLTYANGQDRKIISVVNPSCTDCSSDTVLVYIQAKGPKDIIHQIWDFTGGLPSVVYAIGNLNSSLSISWFKQKPSKFVFTEHLSYSFAAAINKLFEYDDLNDNGHYDPTYPHEDISLDDLSWRLKNNRFTEEEAMLMMHGELKNQSGSIDFKLDLLPYKDYATDLPHLIHTANSTLIDIQLVNLTTSRKFNSSRFALQFVLVSTDSTRDSWNYTMRKSLDDEHTPGVFEIMEIKSPRSSRSSSGGFLQFRPVAYTDPERGVSSSTNAHIILSSNRNRTHFPNSGIIKRFYHDCSDRAPLMQNMVISYGLVGDGFYKQYNYTAWSFTFGYGAPPIERFSLFVIIIIAIGLGVPVLLAISGIIYALVRRCKQRNSPTRFTNDE